MASIQGIYVALFGRPADPGGLAYFNEATNGGADLSSIGDLAATEEYQARFRGFEKEQVIQAVYQSLFEREAYAEEVEYWLELWATQGATINNIAIRILDAARNDDLLTVNAKIAAADLFTAHLDLNAEKEAYVGRFAESVGRDYLDAVTKDDTATPQEADTSILRLFPNQGGGNTGGGSNPEVPFSVSIEGGVLTFRGTAVGDIVADVNETGQLVFYRGAYNATLTEDEEISSIQGDVPLHSRNANSDVLAKGPDGWYFAQGGSLFSYPADGLDFYGNPTTGAEGALGTASNILLLTGFNIADFTTDQDVPWTSLLESLLDGSSSPDILEVAGVVDQVAQFLSSDLNVTIAAAKSDGGAFTSLNPVIDDIINDISGGEESLPGGLPNLGMPILLEGEATQLSADSDGGFILVGNVEYLRDAATAALSGDIETALGDLQDGLSDVISGGAGDDILVGLGDQGSYTVDWIFNEGSSYPAGDAAHPLTIQTTGDVLTGGEGADIFIHIELTEQVFDEGSEFSGYSDGFDTITDFGAGDMILLVHPGASYFWTRVDTDGVEGFDSTLITFVSDNYSPPSDGQPQLYTSGILLEGYTGFLQNEFFGNGIVGVSASEFGEA